MNGFSEIIVLPFDKIAFVKKILIPVKIGRKESYVYFIYVRKPNQETYKLDLKKQNQFERCLNGILENEYPNDRLDELIQRSIQSKYPEATSSTVLCLCNTDLDALNRFINVHPFVGTSYLNVIYMDVVSNLIMSRDCGFSQRMQIYSNDEESIKWTQNAFRMEVLEQEGLLLRKSMNDSMLDLQTYLEKGWQ